MALLGKAFAFYAQHPQEMDMLYGTEDEELMKLFVASLSDDDRGKFGIMVNEIGKYAEREVKEFLNFCRQEVESYFSGFLRIEMRRGKNPWLVEWYLSDPKKRKPREHNLTLGISIDTWNQQLRIYSWIWIRGGKQKEEQLYMALKKYDVKYRSKDLKDTVGLVFLEAVPIEANMNFEIDADPLIEKCINAFRKISKGDWAKLLSL